MLCIPKKSKNPSDFLLTIRNSFSLLGSFPHNILQQVSIHLWKCLASDSGLPIEIPSLSQLSPFSIESSKICGKNEVETFLRIVLPSTKNGIIFCFIFLLILCFGEISLTQMLSPPGFQTLAMRIETLMHYANYSAVASLSLSMIAILCSLFYILVRVWK